MSKKIDVQKLAAELKIDNNELFSEAVKAMKSELQNNPTNSNIHISFLLDVATRLRDHSEQFTIQLIQKVVDEIKD
ncbi:hypothetical protein DFP93_102156 [Aneurinibacillus soli]|uniref:Uncharacterized protein n=1 Tax=Aneurinibacillus soli TaxID=1500254 RepID=A0A0U4WFT4_9BACL|nr:hypothetical protein [Aneurinibacillus soli]PYE63472.1 hypothetical protein DFP93_102156 [Aneurinibacillus soli]BAU27595.1 hypothetical protein CB4_01769 [Aneurinibacillus soli]